MLVCMVVFSDLAYDFRVYREVQTLLSAGHHVHLIASQFCPQPLPASWNGVEIELIPVDPGRLRRSYPDFWKRATDLAFRADADVYHAHDLDALLPAARAARRRGRPLIYDSHELWTEQSSLVGRRGVRGFWCLLERRLIRHVSRIVTVSEPIARRLQERYRPPRPVAVVRNLPPFRGPVASTCVRDALQLSSERPVALYQGGFLTDNGLVQQIEAMATVTNGDLVLLGGGPTEPLLRQRIEELRLNDRVHLLPRVPFARLHEYTCSVDLGLCVIRPTGGSFLWSLPNKLFEYLLAGLPVVAGNTPAIRDVIEKTGAGIVVDPLDPRSIARTLEQLFDAPERRAEMAGAARRSATDYCWEREETRLLEVYADL
ncbi:MAG: glycosyltransferase family 4 protein [Candidatus Latescibacterota bacterium]|nr:glycosyltransferase family 4 protein [Candidatus Latescibacterota bacterium]